MLARRLGQAGLRAPDAEACGPIPKVSGAMTVKDPEYAGESAIYCDHGATGVEGDVAFYVDEARRAGSPVLELGCGTSRILISTAEAGVEVAGLDASYDMLMITRGKREVLAPDARQRAKLVEGESMSANRRREFLHPRTGNPCRGCRRTGQTTNRADQRSPRGPDDA